MTTTETKSASRTDFTHPLDGISTDIGLLILRVVFGLLFAAHGAQKLFGWFDGMGYEAAKAAFDGLGYNPGAFFATLAALSELVGGLLLAAGLLTPLASAIVVGTVINIIYVTWEPGLFGQGGWELGLMFGVFAAAVAFTGPGKFSLDAGRPWERKGFVWGVGAIVLAVVAGGIILILESVL
ncbi:DoxX family protein [Nocardia puris]|uniref:Putative oxidoreductase n=1 Tax=Nocardia puris TaxID=208602 RepID=A0A366CWC9_9NOCA|nr:DoxX family protein [Nocardia puris]MBF6215571.1 DoxX family protein [Nocardia puris]MBF6370020.1 DoxX family protein [Nocardia puris]MBF6463514.1 DoxX family protein [Nocardia puris]RBO82137.1 putative oxidoreductase [Nocardia puris]